MCLHVHMWKWGLICPIELLILKLAAVIYQHVCNLDECKCMPVEIGVNLSSGAAYFNLSVNK